MNPYYGDRCLLGVTVDGTFYGKTLIKESNVQSYEGAQSNQLLYFTTAIS